MYASRLPSVFISYRRDDTAGYAGRLADSLEMHLGGQRIFRDVDDIKPGDDFVDTIERNLRSASILLVIVGKNWLAATDDQGRSRLHNPKDFVRLEIETALRLGCRIVPILVDGAVMPSPEELPRSIRTLAFRQALQCSDNRWDEDVDKLIALMSDSKAADSRTQSGVSEWMAKARYSIAAVIALFAGIGLYLAFQWSFLTPDVSGNWYFENGSYLLITQDSDHFQIEHIDPSTQTIYEKGKGTISHRQLEFGLDPLYSDRYRYRGSLQLDWKNTRLYGQLLEVMSNDAVSVELKRDKPG